MTQEVLVDLVRGEEEEEHHEVHANLIPLLLH